MEHADAGAKGAGDKKPQELSGHEDPRQAAVPSPRNTRSLAAAQIQRSLKAWRDRDEAETEPDGVAQASEGDSKTDGGHARSDDDDRDAKESQTTRVTAKLKSLSRKVYRADKPIKHLGTGYYRGGSGMEAREGADITVKNGLVQPGKGLSVNQNPEDKFIVQYGGAHAVMSVPDTLVIIQKGRPGHYEICAKAPMPVAAFQAALKSIPLQKWENK